MSMDNIYTNSYNWQNIKILQIISCMPCVKVICGYKWLAAVALQLGVSLYFMSSTAGVDFYIHIPAKMRQKMVIPV